MVIRTLTTQTYRYPECSITISSDSSISSTHVPYSTLLTSLTPMSTPLTISGYQNMIELTLASALITTLLLLLLQQRQLHRQAVRPRMVVRVQRQKRIRTRDEEQEEDEGGWAIGAHRLASRERQPLPLPIQRDDGSGRFRKSRLVFGDNVPDSEYARRVHGNGRVEMQAGVDVDSQPKIHQQRSSTKIPNVQVRGHA
jgi:hypothetical protein